MPHLVLMPSLAAGMEEGVIVRWLKAEGDSLAIGESLVEIETDKVTMEYAAEVEGTIGRILVADAGTPVPVGTPIAALIAVGESRDALKNTQPPVADVQRPASSPSVAPEQSSETETSLQAHGRLFVSPLARRVAASAGVDLAALIGSGPNGRITKKDVVAVSVRGSAAGKSVEKEIPSQPASTAASPGEDIPHSSRMRRTIAQRLSEAKRNIPHFYLNTDCRVDALLDLRATLNTQRLQADRLSVNDFVIRAAALALRQVPETNAMWTDDAIRRFHAVDIAVAVATEGGLLTPVIRMADEKSVSTIAREVRALATCAREGTLRPEAYQGGGFSISNLGMYGVTSFSAIINPPQSCILAVGAIESRAVVDDGAIMAANMMSCTLSVDHRSVDGATGGRWLAAFKALIEEPLTMLA